MVTAPRNLENDDIQSSRRYGKGLVLRRYLPLWTSDEPFAVAGSVYRLSDQDDMELVHVFRKYGGVPRSIFNAFKSRK